MIPTISAALSERGYTTLTDVQEAVLNPEYEGKDLLVSARTGSGKTVGFGLAIASDFLDEDGSAGRAGLPVALIVAPTRELAFQVSRELEWLYAKTGAVIASAVGGMDPRNERRALERGAHIVVGTPGRIRDHIQRNALDLTMARAVVLDEADEMLDLGFREDLEFILAEAPEDRRTLMFSATVPPLIAKLAKDFQKDALRVEVSSKEQQHSDISYQVLNCAPHDSEHAIINALLFHDPDNTIIFANTRAAVARLTARLSNRGFQVVSLSGEMKITRLLKWAKLEAEWTEPPSAEAVQAREEERLINHPAWSEAINDDQAAFAGKLLEKYSPEQVAAAYLRLYQERRCPPEELGGVSVDREKKKQEFGPSVWFKLSIGRNERAEPRWLLPMLCKQSGLNKNAIGRIRINDKDTYVEVQEEAGKAMVSLALKRAGRKTT
ncbi:MAG: DEAD/DEAH box helicase [Marivivens sp.]|nr:DEAD/DEAH box helicase [Marivivens sp.]